MQFLWWSVLGVMAFAACGDNTDPTLAGTSRVFRREFPTDTNQSFDVLFVIDDSPAMAPFATKLSANAREMIGILTPMFGPDLHVGVVTTDPADAGRLRSTTSIAGSFLTTSIQFDFSVQTNATGAPDDAFVALADVGATGSSGIQPLAMAQAALAPAANPGFRRDDAHLGIVFITAGDDSSPGTVADYAQAFKQVVSDPSDLVVSIASGPCSTSSLSAPDAPRLTSFAAQFPNRAVQVGVCDDSLADLVKIEFQLIKTAIGDQCIDAPLVMPPECSFWLERAATSEQRIIEPCPSSAIPCWSIVSEPQCAAEPHLSSDLVPGIRTEAGVTEKIECIVE